MDPNAQPPHTEFVNLNKDFRNTIFGSVGCFILKTYTQPTAGGFTTKAPINVQGMITNIMVSTKEIKDASQAPPMSPACEFREERCFAYGTGFLIKKIDEKNLIIATAGHCVLKEEKNPQGICEVKDTVAQSFFAFGATLDVSTNIPTESVWGIDRFVPGLAADLMFADYVVVLFMARTNASRTCSRDLMVYRTGPAWMILIVLIGHL